MGSQFGNPAKEKVFYFHQAVHQEDLSCELRYTCSDARLQLSDAGRYCSLSRLKIVEAGGHICAVLAQPIESEGQVAELLHAVLEVQALLLLADFYADRCAS